MMKRFLCSPSVTVALTNILLLAAGPVWGIGRINALFLRSHAQPAAIRLAWQPAIWPLEVALT